MRMRGRVSKTSPSTKIQRRHTSPIMRPSMQERIVEKVLARARRKEDTNVEHDNRQQTETVQDGDTVMTERPYTGPSRDDAWALLCEYTQGESLRKHALAVEAAVLGYTEAEPADRMLWSVTAVLHDFDYERWPSPEDHPMKGSAILAERGYPEAMRTAILGHATYSGVARDSRLAKVLFACDELAGFIVAVALVRPSKKLADVTVKSIKKKLKDKGFARQVSREDIRQGVEELGEEPDAHIGTVLQGMQAAAESLGL